jgi:hypothetical protein
MRKKLMWFVCLGVSGLVLYLCGGPAWATPATGFVGTTIALGRFGEIEALNTQVLATNPWRDDGQGKNVWLSLQKTKGSSDLYVQNNVIQSGGDSGWHSHPGSTLVMVTAGTVTAYESDDPDCKPTVYTQGMGFVEAGVHLIRNESAVVASTMALQLIPANAARRIDEPQPSNCH